MKLLTYVHRPMRDGFLLLQIAVIGLLLVFSGTVVADSVFVPAKHNKRFIADRGLFVKALDTGVANTICAPNGRWYDLTGHDFTHLPGTTTDVGVRRHSEK